MALATVTNPAMARHSAMIRVTHWLMTIAFFALLVSGLEIVISHPRFYWGEVGNSGVAPLFTLPIPASRGTVPTGYKFVMPDQNGWSRYLHFQAAWAVVLTGLVYVVASLWNGHFKRDLVPGVEQRKLRAFGDVFAKYLRGERDGAAGARTYNVMQRSSYLVVIFVLFPLMIWTGLAMSPAFTSAVPIAVTALGGRQTARTLHFVVTWALVAFVVVHVAMVVQAGFRVRMRAMISGRVVETEESV